MRRALPGEGSPRGFLTWVLLAIGLTACDISPFTLGGGTSDDAPDAALHDGGMRDGGGNGDGGMSDAMPDACSPFPERCNLQDDDCDGETDETFDLTQDPANCGSCGTRCFQPNAAGTCVASDCEYACLPGFVDTDGNVGNGCEYLCTVTSGGVEVCDEADNDCDEAIDENLGLDMDENNCGSCGNRCVALHATPICDDSICEFGACDLGFADIVPAIAGCEYDCPVFPVEVETCDGEDDNCDGMVDELPITGLGGTCTDPDSVLIGDTGACEFGVEACSFGVEVCQGYTRPKTEVCDDSHVGDAADEDCDGDTDEDWDKDTDPRHCGSCAPCIVPNAIPACVTGGCEVAACLPGFVDLLDDPGDPLTAGCEYACTPTGPETCDGNDNDCDGLTDLADADLVAPTNFCNDIGACFGTDPTCAADGCGGPVTWTCDYDADVEIDGSCDLVLEESRCDGLDGDCDGATDESYPDKGDVCDDGGVGLCQGTGDLRCTTAGTALECIITDPGAASTGEICDNLDQDCDGDIDEDAPDEMVTVVDGATTYYVYKYEASRPDSTNGSFGFAEHRSCSKPGVLPWRSVSHLEAAAACASAGKRLCTEAEWQFSCEGAGGLEFPYGNTYQPAACNGRDVDLDCTDPDADVVARTGTIYGDTNLALPGCQAPATSACVSPSGAFDLSGNLREWTSTPIGASAFRVKGGAFDNIEEGLSCDFSFLAFASDVELPNLGFRCCSSTP